MPTKHNTLSLGYVECPVCRASHSPSNGILQNGVYAADCLNCGHYFKFRTTNPVRSSFTFQVNGKDVTVDNEIPLTTSLSEFLRQKGLSYGTKIMCIEGGCGVCVVTAAIPDALTEQPQIKTVNSCCVPVFMCDGWAITTIEGLGNTTDGLHPLQQRLADYNGTQCGYCSPAQIMNMYSLLKTNPKPTKQEVEDYMNITVCRCTGYRSILDTMKSFCVDVDPSLPGGLIDIEELDRKICKKTGNACSGNCSNEPKNMLRIVTARAQWLKPSNKQELLTLLGQHKGDKYRLVFGNTGYGVFKDIGDWNYDVVIDIRGVLDFYSITVGSTGITMGSNMSLTDLLEFFTKQCSQASDKQLKDCYGNICDHLQKVATTSIRNLGTWAGNLMMKHKHPEFVSDMYIILEALHTQLVICDETGEETSYSIGQFLQLDMTGKVITKATIPPLDKPNVVMKTYKVMPRAQNAHAFVAAGFNIELDPATNYTVKGQPSITFVGISKHFTHATKTESYLIGKKLGGIDVLQGALNTLSNELIPDADTSLTPAESRKQLAIALFYKFVLGACSRVVSPEFQSGATELVRPLSSGTQSYGTSPDEYPVSKPIQKIDATIQTSGEAEYIADTPPMPNEVYAAFVISNLGNAEIDTMDASLALSLPGVLKFLTAKDIPGVNNTYPPPVFQVEEEVFSSGKVHYAGQPLGLIVAENQLTANVASGLVKVTYKNVQPPILTVDQAIRHNSFFKPPDPVKKGDAATAISKSSKKIKGQIMCGEQYHYQLETHISICYPTEDGMNIKAATQWMDGIQRAVGQVLNIPDSSVYVEVKRLGGAFGSKITRNLPVSTACAVAAHIMRRPVRLMMDIHTNMKTIGKRVPYLAKYQIGFTDDGLLNGLIVDYYADAGATPNDISVAAIPGWIDNAYFCDNWTMNPYSCRTNKPANTACRSPGSAPAIFIMESIMEHVAKSLGKDQLEVRKLNLYKQGQKTPTGLVLKYCNIESLVTQLETSAEIVKRKQEIAAFNKVNRWKKHGISVMPLKFAIGWASAQYNTLVTISNGDGSIAIYHGGVSVGQGINTKVSQVCAYELGVPMDIIRVKKTNSATNNNSITTGGSITSELCSEGVIKCCEMLKARMAPVKAKMVNPTWKDLVAKCYDEGVDITARYITEPKDVSPYAHYNIYGVCSTEVELDVLTGEHQILRTDILYDGGQSLNPLIDIGQAEGAYVMAVGYWLTERTVFDQKTGENLSSNTWEYHTPMYKDIPIDFRVQYQKNTTNPRGILGSKTAGEPPFCMATTALLAVKHAIEASRKDINKDVFFSLYGPATVDVVQRSCLTDISNMTFGN